MYVECIVMRQGLTRRKRNKRSESCASSGVVGEVLFGKDLEQPAERWSLDTLRQAAAQPEVWAALEVG